MTRRAFADKFISGINAFYYGVTEPIALRATRAVSRRDYGPDVKDPLVTVYTPTYNRARILMQRALPSVLAQSYRNIEYIVVGDHCTDNTEELVSGAGDPRIRFYNIPKRTYRYPPTAENHWLAGPVVPANKALELARGEWIARIDDDDTWTPDHIEILLRFARQGDYEFVSARYISERRGEKVEVAGAYAQDPYYTRSNKPVKGYNPKIGGTSTWLYRSYLRFFKYNINCWRKSWNRVNDIDLSLRFFKAGVKIGFLEKPVAFIFPRPGETTVGLEAYKLAEKEKEEHFAFKSH